MGWTTGTHWLNQLNPNMTSGLWFLSGSITALITLMAGIIPSAILTFIVNQFAYQYQNHTVFIALKQGLSPIALALLLSTGYLMSKNTVPMNSDLIHTLSLWGVTLISALIAWKTKIHLLILLGIGVLLGALGCV
jgi:chromate transporter